MLAQRDQLKPEVVSRAEEAGKPPQVAQGKPKHGGSLPLLVITARKVQRISDRVYAEIDFDYPQARPDSRHAYAGCPASGRRFGKDASALAVKTRSQSAP